MKFLLASSLLLISSLSFASISTKKNLLTDLIQQKNYTLVKGSDICDQKISIKVYSPDQSNYDSKNTYVKLSDNMRLANEENYRGKALTVYGEVKGMRITTFASENTIKNTEVRTVRNGLGSQLENIRDFILEEDMYYNNYEKHVTKSTFKRTKNGFTVDLKIQTKCSEDAISDDCYGKTNEKFSASCEYKAI